MTETDNKKEHLHAGKRDFTWKVFLMFRPPHLIQDTRFPPMDESTSQTSSLQNKNQNIKSNNRNRRVTQKGLKLNKTHP